MTRGLVWEGRAAGLVGRSFGSRAPEGRYKGREKFWILQEKKGKKLQRKRKRHIIGRFLRTKNMDMETNSELPTGRWLEILIGVMATMLILALCGCSKTIYVETVRADSVEITRWQRDSIWVHDSTYVTEKTSGDTVYVMVDRWHIKYVERGSGDSAHIATHDTIPMPYPVEVVKEVPRKAPWWEKILMWAGGLALGGGLGWLVLRKLVFGKGLLG